MEKAEHAIEELYGYMQRIDHRRVVLAGWCCAAFVWVLWTAWEYEQRMKTMRTQQGLTSVAAENAYNKASNAQTMAGAVATDVLQLQQRTTQVEELAGRAANSATKALDIVQIAKAPPKSRAAKPRKA